ncbi:MAG: DUF192 domain-containing protein [bacterium]|nr:DUF192 domain-containing protein [bacterium]
MSSKTLLTGRVLLSVLYLSIAVAILATAMLAVPAKKVTEAFVFLGGEEISITIVDTPALREQGLSGHKALKQNEGMFFIFEESGKYGFWMKAMLFPIDIIWFDEDKKIVDVWENATPSSYPEVRVSNVPAQYVLEVNAGYYKNHALKVGDMLELKLHARYNK